LKFQEIFSEKKDEDHPEKYVLDSILDVAGQKGTGKWTVVSALDTGMPLTMIGEAVFSRCLSSMKNERVEASKLLKGPSAHQKPAKEAFINSIKNAVYSSKIVSYAQGYVLMRGAAKEFGWNLNYGGIALMWRGGCIIRSKFLGMIKEAFDKNPNLSNLLLAPFFTEKIQNSQAGWREVVANAALHGIPIPGISSALSYYDGFRCAQLPANLLQAQRDYFGAHTYERVDKERGKFFHTNWTGRGGNTASSSYNV